MYCVYFIIFLMVFGIRGQGRNPGTHRILTFNTGLTPRVEQYDLRRNHVADSILDLQPDIACLQEVWYSDDMTGIVDSTREVYPYSYSDIHQDVGEITPTSYVQTPCLSVEFMQVMSCIALQCQSTNGSVEYLTCARDRCNILERLDQSCITCLVITGSSNIADRCLGDFGTEFNVPGLLLLSKYPLRNVRSDRFVPDTTLFLPRGYITAEVDGIGTMVCTHTTANLGYGNFEGYTSWEAQNLAEARHLVQYLQDKSNVIVMGDLNSSPYHPSTSVDADMPGFYNYFTDHGYTTPYMESVGTCTWCVYNPISHAVHNLVLDHVLMKNITTLTVRRVFDENLLGEDVPLSDHYGIEVRILAGRQNAQP